MRWKQLRKNLKDYDEGDPKQLRKAMQLILKLVNGFSNKFDFDYIVPLDIALGTALSIETGIHQLTISKLNALKLDGLKLLVVDTFMNDVTVVDTVTRVLVGRGAHIMIACLCSNLNGVQAVFRESIPTIYSNNTGVYETWERM